MIKAPKEHGSLDGFSRDSIIDASSIIMAQLLDTN